MTRVHPPSDSQAEVFSEIQPLIVSLLDGSATLVSPSELSYFLSSSLNSYDVCVMAYGQTGSGKTHTMLGSHSKVAASGEQDGCGVLICAMRELFR